MSNNDYIELLEIAKKYEPTEEEIKQYWNSIIEMNKKAEEQTRRSNSREFMNRTYNL